MTKTILILGCLMSPLIPGGCAWVEPPPIQASAPGEDTRILEHYKSEFHRNVGNRVEGGASLRTMLQSISRANLLLLGDYHTDRAYHARALALLDRIADHVGPLLLIIEFLRWEDRDDLKAYLEGRLSLAGLRRRVNHRNPRSWLGPKGCDPQGFAAFLERARTRGWLVFPVEDLERPPLDHRDRVIAARARSIIQQHRGHYPVVFFGSAHLLGRGRLDGLLQSRSITVLPRPPQNLLYDTDVIEGGIQKIRDRVYYLGHGSEITRSCSP